MNILFICTGNTCRSPMSEAILQHKLPIASVQSAGIYANRNDRANKHTLYVLQKRGIHLEHYSQPVTDHLLDWADYVFTMTRTHKQLLLLQYPEYGEKYFVFKQFINDRIKNRETDIQSNDETTGRKRKVIEQKNPDLTEEQLEKRMNRNVKKELSTNDQSKENLDNFDVLDP